MKHVDKGMVLGHAVLCNEKHPTSFKFYPKTNMLWVHVDLTESESIAWSFDFSEELDRKYFDRFKEFVRKGTL